MVAQEVGDLLVCGYEAAERCERLGEGAHDKVYVVGEAEVVHYSASSFAEDSDAVGFVYHQARVIFLGQPYHLGKVCYVAFH